MSEHRESWRIEKELKEQQTKIQKVQENISALLSYIENDNFLIKNKVFDKEQLKPNIEEYNRRLEEDKITLQEYEKQLQTLENELQASKAQEEQEFEKHQEEIKELQEKGEWVEWDSDDDIDIWDVRLRI